MLTILPIPTEKIEQLIYISVSTQLILICEIRTPANLLSLGESSKNERHDTL